MVSERRPAFPKYGPWLIGERPKINIRATQIGGNRGQPSFQRDPSRKSWKDMMQEASGSGGLAKDGSDASLNFCRSGSVGQSDRWRRNNSGSQADITEKLQVHEEGTAVSSQSRISQTSQPTARLFGFDLNAVPEEGDHQGAVSGMDMGIGLRLSLGDGGAGPWVPVSCAVDPPTMQCLYAYIGCHPSATQLCHSLPTCPDPHLPTPPSDTTPSPYTATPTTILSHIY